MHEVLVNRLGGLSLPRKHVVRLTDRPDMTLDVYRGRKTTIQQQPVSKLLSDLIYTFLLKEARLSKNMILQSGKNLLLCSHSPNDVPPRTSAERIHSRGTGRRASVRFS